MATVHVNCYGVAWIAAFLDASIRVAITESAVTAPVSVWWGSLEGTAAWALMTASVQVSAQAMEHALSSNGSLFQMGLQMYTETAFCLVASRACVTRGGAARTAPHEHVPMTAQATEPVLRMAPVSATATGVATIVLKHGVLVLATIVVHASGEWAACVTWATMGWIVEFLPARTTALGAVYALQHRELNMTLSDPVVRPKMAMRHASIRPRRAAYASMAGAGKIARTLPAR